MESKNTYEITKNENLQCREHNPELRQERQKFAEAIDIRLGIDLHEVLLSMQEESMTILCMLDSVFVECFERGYYRDYDFLAKGSFSELIEMCKKNPFLDLYATHRDVFEKFSVSELQSFVCFVNGFVKERIEKYRACIESKNYSADIADEVLEMKKEVFNEYTAKVDFFACFQKHSFLLDNIDAQKFYGLYRYQQPHRCRILEMISCEKLARAGVPRNEILLFLQGHTDMTKILGSVYSHFSEFDHLLDNTGNTKKNVENFLQYCEKFFAISTQKNKSVGSPYQAVEALCKVFSQIENIENTHAEFLREIENSENVVCINHHIFTRSLHNGLGDCLHIFQKSVDTLRKYPNIFYIFPQSSKFYSLLFEIVKLLPEDLGKRCIFVEPGQEYSWGNFRDVNQVQFPFDSATLHGKMSETDQELLLKRIEKHGLVTINIDDIEKDRYGISKNLQHKNMSWKNIFCVKKGEEGIPDYIDNGESEYVRNTFPFRLKESFYSAFLTQENYMEQMIIRSMYTLTSSFGDIRFQLDFRKLQKFFHTDLFAFFPYPETTASLLNRKRTLFSTEKLEEGVLSKLLEVIPNYSQEKNIIFLHGLGQLWRGINDSENAQRDVKMYENFDKVCESLCKIYGSNVVFVYSESDIPCALNAIENRCAKSVYGINITFSECCALMNMQNVVTLGPEGVREHMKSATGNTASVVSIGGGTEGIGGEYVKFNANRGTTFFDYRLWSPEVKVYTKGGDIRYFRSCGKSLEDYVSVYKNVPPDLYATTVVYEVLQRRYAKAFCKFYNSALPDMNAVEKVCSGNTCIEDIVKSDSRNKSIIMDILRDEVYTQAVKSLYKICVNNPMIIQKSPQEVLSRIFPVFNEHQFAVSEEMSNRIYSILRNS